MNKFLKILVLLIICLALMKPLFAEEIEILGAGATFPYPLYSKLFELYNNEYKIKVNYQAIGSGGGIRQLLNKLVDFGASDAFLDDKELENVPLPILHIPICIGAVTLTYNLPKNPEINLTPEVISEIFLGKIKKWNDPKIKSINEKIELPNQDILVIHRSDGSGTTFILTDYLSKISSEWKEKVGRGQSINWPVGLGAKGNAGVANLIKQTPNSIGYMELVYALQNNLPSALIKNKKGNFIKPTLESIKLAAQVNIPDDTRIYFTDTEADNGYPLSSFTWILVFKEQNYDGRTKEKAKNLVNLLLWMIKKIPEYGPTLNYSPLPEEANIKAEKIIRSISYDGKPLLETK